MKECQKHSKAVTIPVSKSVKTKGRGKVADATTPTRSRRRSHSLDQSTPALSPKPKDRNIGRSTCRGIAGQGPITKRSELWLVSRGFSRPPPPKTLTGPSHGHPRRMGMGTATARSGRQQYMDTPSPSRSNQEGQNTQATASVAERAMGTGQVPPLREKRRKELETGTP